MSNKIRTALSERVRFPSPVGEREVPTFALDENGEVVVSGKTNLFAEIQSHLDEVVLDKILARCAVTGETLIASDESFGDSSVLPVDLLDAKTKMNAVNDFKAGLNNDDLSLLVEKGFDEFLKIKLEALQASQQVKSEVSKDE